MRNLIFLLLAGQAIACGGEEFVAPMQLGGESIDADTLNRGYRGYMRNCYACHGEQGDGHGPAAAYLRPPPRDFRAGMFKFGLAINGLPHTQDLVSLVRRGLTGTAMLPWDLKEEQLTDIIHYIKTFSDAWKCEPHPDCEGKCARTDADGKVSCFRQQKLGKRIEAPADPWSGRTEEAISRGEAVYHIGAQCRKCHPAYITQERLGEITQGDQAWAYGEMTYRSALRKSNEYKVEILPIDFLYHDIKNLRADDSVQHQREMLFKVIGAGVNGAAMPTWKGALTDEDLWALAYYVQDLHGKRDTPAAYALRRQLAEQPAYTPPTAEAGAGSDGAASE